MVQTRQGGPLAWRDAGGTFGRGADEARTGGATGHDRPRRRPVMRPQTRSNTPAAPMPVPMHMLIMP